MSQVTESPMKKISLEKVVLNMGIGKSGDVIDIAKKALEQISGKKPSTRNAKDTQREWGVRKGEPIGVAVTIRGDDAVALLKRLLEAKGNSVNGRSFDNFGNYSFGINEHIDIPDPTKPLVEKNMILEEVPSGVRDAEIIQLLFKNTT